jgi:hypothetical protein
MTQRKGVGKVFGRAVAGPLNLGVLGGAVVGAVALASWPIAAVGGAAYLALVAADMSSPEFRRRVLFGRERPAKLPAPDALQDPEVRAQVERIAAARGETDRALKTMPDRLQRNMAQAITAIRELEGHVAQLAVRADGLSRYLAGADPRVAQRDADALAARAAQTQDPAARASYEAAAATGRERVAAITDIATARERALAHLARVEAAIKAMPSKLVRLRALDDQASDALTGDVGAELERMNIDLRAFEDTLASIAEVTT